MAAVQSTAQELVCLLLQVPLPWESHRCVSLCQLLNRSSRLQCQLPELMQQVLKCYWLHSNGAQTTAYLVWNADISSRAQISVCQ